MKKIYFAFSIRGEKGDQEVYRIILKTLKEKYCVINEECIMKLLCDESEILSDEAIYKRDVEWISQCDIVVAECSQPSLGIGYEVAYAEKLKKDVYVLYHAMPNKRLSAMIDGNRYFKKLLYSDIESLLAKLKKNI